MPDTALYELKATGLAGYVSHTSSGGELCRFHPLLAGDSYIEMPTKNLRGLSRPLTDEECQSALKIGLFKAATAEPPVFKEPWLRFLLRTLQSIIGLLAAIVALTLAILIAWHALGLTVEMAVSAGVVLSIGGLTLWGLSGLFSNGFSGRRTAGGKNSV